MTNAAATYRKAVNVLKPSKARMDAIHAAQSKLHAQARAIVADRMQATGVDALTLYREACAARTANDDKLASEIRVVLLGMVRRAAK